MSQRPMTYYAVTRERRENWNARFSMRQQEKWDEHATFMNALIDDGFVVLGGPLGNGEDDPADHQCRKRAGNCCPTRRRSLDIYGVVAHRKGRALGDPPWC